MLSKGMRVHEFNSLLAPRRYFVYGACDKVRPGGFETASDSIHATLTYPYMRALNYRQYSTAIWFHY